MATPKRKDLATHLRQCLNATIDAAIEQLEAYAGSRRGPFRLNLRNDAEMARMRLRVKIHKTLSAAETAELWMQ
ncbi:hypothetical protein GR212_31625 [Rhizobium lusitanum]|uniref:Uncharacterized protein n=1 Tax=Rhizobium lusitanum TaxID=293958 RepID=A0A6L9UJQ2_9HYPH|nr:hypothetical protein [Rhizobium lusitanum]NEI74110.1 hypothetical protein [Rhizobium lusitanum]